VLVFAELVVVLVFIALEVVLVFTELEVVLVFTELVLVDELFTELEVVLVFIVELIIVVVEDGVEEAGTEEGDEPLIEHPTRLELTAMSSYQKVLTSPP